MTINRVKVSSQYRCTTLSQRAKKLRRHVLHLLRKQKFRLGQDYQPRLITHSKGKIREIHTHFREARLAEEREFVNDWFPKISKYFASGSDIDPVKIDPVPILVDDNEEHAALFRVACHWWSIPVSKGYGRRFRILVIDKSNGKLFGMLALTDPVFNLKTRDSWIGWDVHIREQMLSHVMDACVLGAVPPYNQLLGAKFIGMLAASDFTRSVFAQRYKRTKSIILKKEFDGRLALVTTTSALGTSSVLNRLRFGGEDIFKPLGFTEGYGHFHLANGTFEKIRTFLRSCKDEEVESYQFGNGPNYRIRVVRKALERLRLPADLLRHGVRRGVYAAPLAHNAVEFLSGKATELSWYQRPLSSVVGFWRERWLLPRASRDTSYRDFDRNYWHSLLNLKIQEPRGR
jgi:uncharacterized protein DUF4338